MKTMKHTILSSALLLSITSIEGRKWSDAIDHALYQNVAVDTARQRLRIESDPFAGNYNIDRANFTSPPTSSPTFACHTGSMHYQLNFHDSSAGGRWEGTTIQVIGIEDRNTITTTELSTPDSNASTTTTQLRRNHGNGVVSVSNTVEFGSGALMTTSKSEPVYPLGAIFASRLSRGSADHADICLVPQRCYDLIVNGPSETEGGFSWTLTAMVGSHEQEESAYMEGSDPMYCKFSIPDANAEIFCPTECTAEIPEKYLDHSATLSDILHAPVKKGDDGGFSAMYQKFAGKEIGGDPIEDKPKGAYSMFLAVDDEGEENMEVHPSKAPKSDQDNVGFPSPPAEGESRDTATEGETPVEGQDLNPLTDEAVSGSFGESGTFIALDGIPGVQTAKSQTLGGEILSMRNEDDDSLASLGGGEVESVALTTEVNATLASEINRSFTTEEVEASKEKTLVIPVYNSTTQFEQEKAEKEAAELAKSEVVAPTPGTNTEAETRSDTPMKSDSFHILLRHGEN